MQFPKLNLWQGTRLGYFEFLVHKEVLNILLDILVVNLGESSGLAIQI